jgi:hypothetical protein
MIRELGWAEPSPAVMREFTVMSEMQLLWNLIVAFLAVLVVGLHYQVLISYEHWPFILMTKYFWQSHFFCRFAGHSFCGDQLQLDFLCSCFYSYSSACKSLMLQ